VNSSQKGAGSSEAMMIIACAVYFTFIGYLGNATGYSAQWAVDIASVHLPTVTVSSGHWYTFILGAGATIVDILIVIVNLIAWIIGSLASYMSMVGFSFTGHLPAWVSAFMLAPLGIGIIWLIASLIRGRE